MQVVEVPAEFQKEMESKRLQSQSIGFVPTMGYLHQGHLSLVKRSKQENDLTAVSIFVNPTQFNVASDLTGYPRDLKRDLALLADCGTDFAFVPQVNLMYNIDAQDSVAQIVNVSVPAINSLFEGAHRPGHFDGVAIIILKLFNLIGPCKAYFGLKDYQQVMLISELIQELFIPIKVVRCQTVRQSDGLAMSSRNVRLNEHQLSLATELYKSMLNAIRLIQSGCTEVEDVRNSIKDRISHFDEIHLEYVDLVTDGTLVTPNFIEGAIRILIAAKLGEVRLIDNLGIEDVELNELMAEPICSTGVKS